MTNIFLREVHLKDFRTFGEFTLPVAPGPGLTLLVGTNGLGKSSFFDGIEWCLTGAVRRFEDYIGRLKEGDYLTRRDAESGAHKVSLAFSEGNALIRTLNNSPANDALTYLLKKPEWTEIKDIGAYLGFTHFLGQASQQRFTSREKSDQWQALKGPSGIDRLESIRTALRGQATGRAFTRRLEREEAAVDNAARALEEWTRNAVKLAELKSRGAAAGAENEELLDVRLSAIEQALSSRSLSSEVIAERLSIVRGTIEAQQRQLAGNRAGIVSLQAILAMFDKAKALADPDGARLAAAEDAVATAAVQLAEVTAEAANAEQLTARQAEAVARAEMEYSERVRVRNAIIEFGALDSERLTAQADETALRLERDACRSGVLEAQAALLQAREVQATVGRISTAEATLQLWSQRTAVLRDHEETAKTRRSTAIDAGTAAGLARLQLPELQRTLENARNAEAMADARLVALQREASQLAEILSRLVSHIKHDDTHCPVCTSSFPAGELQTQARNALSRQDIRLADDTRALDLLRDQTKTAAQQVAEAEALIFSEKANAAAAEEAEATAENERAAIADGLGVSRDADFASIIAERLNETAQLRSRHMGDAAGGTADVGAAKAHVDALATALASLDERIAAAVHRRTRCEAALSEVRQSLEGDLTTWTAESADVAIEAQRKVLDDARVNLEDLSLKRAASANRVAEARARLAAEKSERERTTEVVREAKAACGLAVNSWLQANMEGEPSAQSIAALEVALGDRASALARYLEEINSLTRSYEAYLAQDEFRALRISMEKQGGSGASDNPHPFTEQLRNQLEAARAALQLTTATRDAVHAYSDQLKAEAESFSTQFLFPLNDLIDGFNRALLSTSGATVQFSAEHTVARTSLAMQLRYSDAVDNAQYKTSLPPQLVLSEGQMAANGFSILCAASTAYRWSRWRALLLDDPLQHNDIIHAAAFVDVMRNLVELENYQLLMSTHKRDEGEYIARKFDAAGLPCTVVELLGPSKHGVRIAPPRHNTAARRLLAEPETRFGSSF